MSVLAPDTVIEGRSYILWVKDGDLETGPDSVYAVVNRGNSRFGYQDFEFVCKTSNKKLFFTNKVNDGQMGSTWAHCLYEMKVKKKPVGNPVCMTDRVYSFSEIATWAYQNNLFTTQDGSQHLASKTSLPSTAILVKDAGAAGSSGLGGPGILTKAKLMSDEMDRFRVGSTNPSVPSLIPSVILNDGSGDVALKALDGVPPAVREEVVDIEDDESLGEELGNMKERAVLAESAAADLQMRNNAMQSKNDELTAKLESSLEQQHKFMAAADRTSATMENMNEDAADKVARALSAKLSSLTSIEAGVGNVLSKLETMSSSISSLPKVLDDQITSLSSQSDILVTKVTKVLSNMDISHESVSEGIMTTNRTLGHFGFADDENNVNVPACIAGLFSSMSQKVKLAPDDVPQVCYYLSRRIASTFTCDCRCGFEIQIDNCQLVSDSDSVPGNGSGQVGFLSGLGAGAGKVMSDQGQGNYVPDMQQQRGIQQPQSGIQQPRTLQQDVLPPVRNMNVVPGSAHNQYLQTSGAGSGSFQYSAPPPYLTPPADTPSATLTRKQKKAARSLTFQDSNNKKMRIGEGQVTQQQQSGLPSQQQLGQPSRQQLGQPSQQQLGQPSQRQLGQPSQQQLGLSSQQQLGLSSQQQLGLSSQQQGTAKQHQMTNQQLSSQWQAASQQQVASQQQAALQQQQTSQLRRVPLAGNASGVPRPNASFGPGVPAPSTSQFNSGPRLPAGGPGILATPWLPNYRFTKPN